LQDNNESNGLTLNSGQWVLIIASSLLSLAIGLAPAMLSTLSL